MKALVIVLGGLLLPLQTYYYMDCCCGDFCTHKNACTGCEEDQSKPCEVHPNHQPSGDCCNDKAKTDIPKEQHKRACSHVSPSSEVTVHAPAGIPAASEAEILLDLPVVPLIERCAVTDYLIEKVPRPASDVPRHLLLSVLQV